MRTLNMFMLLSQTALDFAAREPYAASAAEAHLCGIKGNTHRHRRLTRSPCRLQGGVPLRSADSTASLGLPPADLAAAARALVTETQFVTSSDGVQLVGTCRNVISPCLTQAVVMPVYSVSMS